MNTLLKRVKLKVNRVIAGLRIRISVAPAKEYHVNVLYRNTGKPYDIEETDELIKKVSFFFDGKLVDSGIDFISQDPQRDLCFLFETREQAENFEETLDSVFNQDSDRDDALIVWLVVPEDEEPPVVLPPELESAPVKVTRF